MRITIDVEGAALRAAGTAERNAEDAGEAVDAGGPPPGLLEALALQGALGPVAAEAEALSAAPITAAGPAPPTRTMWETDTLMKKRKD